MQSFLSLIKLGRAEGRTLSFYLGAQRITGTVITMPDQDTVELRNQTHERILIRLERVDAIALASPGGEQAHRGDPDGDL